jgi:hypothetical protein
MNNERLPGNTKGVPMKAEHTSHHETSPNRNHLRRGSHFRVTTSVGSFAGEYLGMETLYGDRAILLRHSTGTDSILLHHVTSVENVA